MTERALITIRVHPGASRATVAAEKAVTGEVGGTGWTGVAGEASGTGVTGGTGRGAGHGQVLGVWVHERAHGGKATKAALAAVAAAAGVRRSSVRLVTGARSRLKIVEVTDPPADLAQRLGIAAPSAG